MKLSELNCGESAEVVKINLAPGEKDRLNRIGIIDGVKITFIRRAPFGGVSEYKIRDFYLALRRETAERIEIKQIR